MEFLRTNFPLLIPLAPLVAAAWSAVPSRREDKSYMPGVVAHAIAFAAALILFVQAVAAGDSVRRIVVCETPWSFLPTVELAIDRLTATMMIVITSIGLVLYRYSIRYLQSEVGQPRYQAMLAVTISTLLVMVSSRDLILLFLTWQLLSWLLCLLSYNYTHLPTARSSFRTFIMLRFGDVAFFAGIVLAFQLYGTVEFTELFARASATSVTLQPFGIVEISGVTAITLLLFVGAMSKSAQFPLHMWLPDSLFAPTPIHGLLHAGIINAGGFLLTRLAPLYVQSPATLHVVFFVGLVTAVLGTSMMLVQNDIKKTLGYSTIGQMGYMIMECGLGAFSLAIFHLIAHGLFKATIFLNCGNIIHETRQEPRRPSPPADQSAAGTSNWMTGFFLSLALPLLIVFVVHKLLNIPLAESQGLVIFLFFSWITACQAMLTLYRLHGPGSFKTQGILLGVITVVTLAYLLAAELFTGFLYPSAETVTEYFRAAALPDRLFSTILLTVTGVIVVGWALAFVKRQGRRLNPPRLVTDLRTALYLFFINRLYLDGVALRLRFFVAGVTETCNRSAFFFPVLILVALSLAGSRVTSLEEVSAGTVLSLLVAGVLLPLFPLHAGYVAALKKVPRPWNFVIVAVMPLVGVYGLMLVLPVIPPAIRPAISAFALCGAIYTSIRAVARKTIPELITHAALAFYSILWWQIASIGHVTSEAIVYTGSVVLIVSGLFLSWDRLQIRYGNLPAHAIGGLAGPMPAFGLCLALLVMAAVGLPPFGFVFSCIGLMLHTPTMTTGTFVVLLAWFCASWYLFKLMQHLLFGPPRNDLRYEDLKPAEIAAFAGILVLLVLLSIVPQFSGHVGPEAVAHVVTEIK